MYHSDSQSHTCKTLQGALEEALKTAFYGYQRDLLLSGKSKIPVTPENKHKLSVIIFGSNPYVTEHFIMATLLTRAITAMVEGKEPCDVETLTVQMTEYVNKNVKTM